ncbi:portal protein [Acinetobacter sp. YH12140]|uniref:portal protein n=1 Tax=Acinetobacter sp. YH12140 TaxID=2601124 RepID=UPI0015D353F2
MTDKDNQLAHIHSLAKQQFDKAQSAVANERKQCLEDRRFYSIAGAQWEGKLGEQFENKPKFEVNKIHLAVIRIINEYRNNRIGVNFISKDGSASDDLADTCAKLYRADEQDSSAEEAYDNAFEEAVGGGFGAWRLRATYEDEDDEENEQQRIRIEPIFDADSCVFFDPDSKRQDKADARYCFVLTAMTCDAYQEEYGEHPASWNKDITTSQFDWSTTDSVYVAEYYRVEKVKEKVITYRLIDGSEERYSKEKLDSDPSILEELQATGAQEVRSRTIERKRIRKILMSGGRVLEDYGFIAGRHIPIVPVYGKRWYIDNMERCMGHVRLCKDAQRLKNMQLSKMGELSAMSSVEKPVLAPEQVAGVQHMWAQDNIENFPYLLAHPLKDEMGNVVAQGPVAYTKPPSIPPAMGALLQVAEQDLSDILGNQDSGDEMQSNISGVAVELIQNRLDMQSFIYISNFAKGVRRSGEIWLSMASELYVEDGRKMKVVGNQDEIDSIELFKPIYNEASGEVERANDLTKAKFDVAIDIGPTSSSKRSATVRSLTNMLPLMVDPMDQQVLGSMIMMNMEGEGVNEVREYYRKKLLRLGVAEPTKEEAQQLAQEAQNQQPDANTLYLQSEAEKNKSLAIKAQADTELAIARAEETKAKAIDLMTRLDMDERQAVLEAIGQLGMQPPQATVQPTQNEEVQYVN